MVLQIIKIELPYNSEISLLSIYPKISNQDLEETSPLLCFHFVFSFAALINNQDMKTA
jgi:hypothetical protein